MCVFPGGIYSLAIRIPIWANNQHVSRNEVNFGVFYLYNTQTHSQPCDKYSDSKIFKKQEPKMLFLESRSRDNEVDGNHNRL